MRNEQYTSVQVDGYTRFCLTAIAVLLTVLVVGLWAEKVDPVDTADAASYKDAKAKKAFEDGRWGTSSAQRKLAATQDKINVKLDELIRVLKSGEVRVQVVQSAGQDSGGTSNVVQIKK